MRKQRQLNCSSDYVSKLYIGNLPFSCTDEILGHIFQHVGTVLYAKVMTDSTTGRSRGFGFVEMASLEDAAEAIARFNGDTYEGRIVTVSKANPKMPVVSHRLPMDLKAA